MIKIHRLCLLAACSLSLIASPLFAAQGITDLSLAGTTTDASTYNASAAHTFLSGARATFASGSTLTINGTLAGAGVFNVSGGTLTLATNQVGWTSVNKTGSSLADLATRSASDLTGTLPDTKGGTGLTALGNGVATALGNATNSAGGFSTIDGTATLTNKTIVTATGTADAPTITGSTSVLGSLWTPGAFRRDDGNPVIASLFEPSIIIEGDTARLWSLGGYATATDASCRVWSALDTSKMPQNMTRAAGGTWNFPYVMKEGSTYYCLMQGGAASGQGDIYMWSSSDGFSWSALNSGNAVLTRSATTTDYYYNLYNPSIAFVGSTIHLLIEGKKSTGGFVILYSSSTLAAGPNFNTSLITTPIITASDGNVNHSVGNSWLTYVPDRNALLTVYGENTNGAYLMRAKYALTSSNLTLAASWVDALGFGLYTSGVHEADPHFAFTTSTNKTFKTLLMWNTAQASGAQAYAQLTLDQFYDLATSPTTATTEKINAAGVVEAFRFNLGHLGQGYIDGTGINTGTGTFSGIITANGAILPVGGIKVIDSTTNAVSTVGAFSHVTSNGTSSNGIGAGISFSVTDSTYATTPTIGWVDAIMTDQVGINGKLQLSAIISNTKTAIVDIDTNGLTSLVAGKTYRVKSGTNALAGTVTLTAGAATISSTAIDANTVITFTLKTVGGTIGGQPYVDTITPGTGCTVAGGGASNTSTYNWVALKVN